MRILVALASLSLCAATSFADPAVDLIFLLDESGSVSGPTFAAEKSFTLQTANALTFGPNDFAASVILHATSSRVFLNLTQSRATFLNSVTNSLVQNGGNSNFTAGFTAAQNQFSSFGRPAAHKIIAVFGDGVTSESGLAAKLDQLAASDVDIFSFLLPGGSVNFMQSLVRNHGKYYVLGDFSNSSFIEDMAQALGTVPGDYNVNGIVDAADYVLWRQELGGTTRLYNDATPGVQAADYDVWRAQFGETLSGKLVNNPAPEPSLVVAVASTLILSLNARRIRF